MTVTCCITYYIVIITFGLSENEIGTFLLNLFFVNFIISLTKLLLVHIRFEFYFQFMIIIFYCKKGAIMT